MLNIFNVKKNNYYKVKTDNKGNDIGQTRHYPPANKEWYNSLYAFYKNTTKLLPVTDKITLKIIKSYFNLYSHKLEKNIKSRHLRMRLRRLSTNRILVSRAELKHRNDLVIITVFVYNRQMKFYLNKIRKLRDIEKLFYLIFSYDQIEELKFKINELSKKRNLSTIQMKNRKTKIIIYKYILRKYSRKINMYTKDDLIVPYLKMQGLMLMRKALKYKKMLSKTLRFENDKDKSYESNFLKSFLLKCLRKEILYLYLKQIISFNKLKFEKTYLLPLTKLIEKIYKKKVEFNLVKLKYLHLNSYIFAETIVTKLRNKKNRLLKVLKASLFKFKVPSFDKLTMFDEIYNRKKLKQNFKINHVLTDPFYKKSGIKANDNLEKLLQIKIENNFSKIRSSNNSDEDIINDNQLAKTVFSSIKYKSVSGIRVEAAGRLTRRNTAARSLFKIRYKGNIKDADSSYKGISSVILRGHAKSNLQYTKLKSKIRIGSFGIKGWVSSN